MANPEHLKIFYDGRERWNEWRRKVNSTPDLTKHDFSRGYLNLFDLSRTLLSGTNFEACHFNGTLLIEADLRGANLKGASLSGADFTRAIFGYTTLTDVILTGVKGLGSTKHVTFSSIDQATLKITANMLASQQRDDQEANEIELFLRSAGVLDDLLGLFRTWAGRDKRYVSCFISYSHKDKAFAERVCSELSARGVTCWLDSKDMLPGEHLYDTVDHAIRQSDKILLCCSRKSLTSWWVDSELDRVMEKEQRLQAAGSNKHCVLIPLDLDGYLFSEEWRSGKAVTVRTRLAADFIG
jgi:hypothetical protein